MEGVCVRCVFFFGNVVFVCCECDVMLVSSLFAWCGFVGVMMTSSACSISSVNFVQFAFS